MPDPLRQLSDLRRNEGTKIDHAQLLLLLGGAQCRDCPTALHYCYRA